MDDQKEEKHVHECKDREDGTCKPRGYCVCECGAQARTFFDGDYSRPLQCDWKQPE